MSDEWGACDGATACPSLLPVVSTSQAQLPVMASGHKMLQSLLCCSFAVLSRSSLWCSVLTGLAISIRRTRRCNLTRCLGQLCQGAFLRAPSRVVCVAQHTDVAEGRSSPVFRAVCVCLCLCVCGCVVVWLCVYVFVCMYVSVRLLCWWLTVLLRCSQSTAISPLPLSKPNASFKTHPTASLKTHCLFQNPPHSLSQNPLPLSKPTPLPLSKPTASFKTHPTATSPLLLTITHPPRLLFLRFGGDGSN